jgi:hypothetical protein
MPDLWYLAVRMLTLATRHCALSHLPVHHLGLSNLNDTTARHPVLRHVQPTPFSFVSDLYLPPFSFVLDLYRPPSPTVSAFLAS